MTTTCDTPTPTVESVWDAVAEVQRNLRWLGSLDLGFLPDEDVDALVPEVEQAARTMPAVQQSLVAQFMDRGMAETYGCTSPMAYLQTRLRLRRSEANHRVGAAERFQPRTALTGERLEPLFPAVASALAEGVLSMDHATVIATSVEHLPAAVSEEDKAHAEQVLVDRARESDPCLVGRYAQRIEAHLDPDGVLTTEQEQREDQELHLRKDLHGMWRLTCRVGAEGAAVIQASLSLLAKPKDQPDGSRDPRPAARRRAEALHHPGLVPRPRRSTHQRRGAPAHRRHPHPRRTRGTGTRPVDHRGPDLRRDHRTDALRRRHLADRVLHRRGDPLPRPRPPARDRSATPRR